MNKNLKISSKLILAFLSVALIPLIISGILYYQHAKKALTHEIYNHLFSVANIQKHRLKSSYEQNIERISLIASRTQMRISLARYLEKPTLVDHQKIKKIIGDARRSIKGILNISVSSVTGLILASTDQTRIGSSIHEQSYFNNGLDSNRADDLSINQSGQLQITISGPLLLDNRLIGVIVVESTAESLLVMTSDYSGLGKTGETMLAKPVGNGNMVYLTPLRFDQNAAVNRILSKKDVDIYLNSGKYDQILKFALDYRSKAVLSVSEQLFIPDWLLIVKIDQEEALEPVNSLILKILLFLMASAVIVLVISFFVSRSISRPVERLTQLANDIGMGQRNIELGPELQQAPHEIHSLGISIDNMSHSLLKSEITSEQARIELKKMAYYDPLTGLANRRFLSELIKNSITSSKRSNTKIAICFLDLDGFKPVNDNYGHDIGDKLLIKIATGLQSVLRSDDKISRLGGDEFAILLANINKLDECTRTLERILSRLSEPHQLGNHVINLSGSIGVTIYPDDKGDPDTLLRHADQAMYLAKEQGRNCYRFFDHDADKEISLKRKHLQQIEEAILNDELVLYYQPKVNMTQGKLIGVEALVRWQHSERGLLSPIEFLPFIEGSALQQELDLWVIREAILQIEQWWSQGYRFSVSINVSPKTILQSDFLSRVTTQLTNQTHIDGSALEFEILESSSLNDLDGVAHIIKQCAQLGVSFSLDDFGTGYSTLTYIRHLPAQVLKIDQSFIRDMLQDIDDLNIVEGVIGLAKAFKRELVAEGIETEEHGIKLISLGCYSGQGYFIAKPMPADEIPQWDKHYQYPDLWLKPNTPIRILHNNG